MKNKQKSGINIAVIAGYDVLADKIPAHQKYVTQSVMFSLQMDANVIFLIGGETNPDYPNLTEAEANYKIIEDFFKDHYEVLEVEDAPEEKIREFQERNDEIIKKISSIVKKGIEEKKNLPNLILPVVKIEMGDTSAQTLSSVLIHLCLKNISVNRLIICAEKSRLVDFSLDALMVKLPDLSQSHIYTYGHTFPESKNNFNSQRKKILMKVLSHRSKIFNLARNICQKFHQIRVACQKRREAKTLRKS